MIELQPRQIGAPLSLAVRYVASIASRPLDQPTHSNLQSYLRRRQRIDCRNDTRTMLMLTLTQKSPSSLSSMSLQLKQRKRLTHRDKCEARQTADGTYERRGTIRQSDARRRSTALRPDSAPSLPDSLPTAPSLAFAVEIIMQNVQQCIEKRVDWLLLQNGKGVVDRRKRIERHNRCAIAKNDEQQQRNPERYDERESFSSSKGHTGAAERCAMTGRHFDLPFTLHVRHVIAPHRTSTMRDLLYT